MTHTPRKELSANLIRRVRVYKRKLADYDDTPLGIALFNFAHNANPSREVRVWETVASSLYKHFEKNPQMPFEERERRYYMLVVLAIGSLPEDCRSQLRYVFQEKTEKMRLALEELEALAPHLEP